MPAMPEVSWTHATVEACHIFPIEALPELNVSWHRLGEPGASRLRARFHDRQVQHI